MLQFIDFSLVCFFGYASLQLLVDVILSPQLVLIDISQWAFMVVLFLHSGFLVLYWTFLPQGRSGLFAWSVCWDVACW